ncbi:MAG: hypothetical protein QM765_43370 [Myxococcales bacterium]
MQLSLRPKHGDETWDRWVRWEPEQLAFPFLAHLSAGKLPSHMVDTEPAWDCFLRVFCEDGPFGARGRNALVGAGRWAVFQALTEQQQLREAWEAQRWRFSREGRVRAAAIGCPPPGDRDNLEPTWADLPATEPEFAFAVRCRSLRAPGEIAREAWVAGVEEFLVMTCAAKRGLKHLCGGRVDDDDRAAYDDEAAGCHLALEALRKLALPHLATGGEARYWALKVLAQVGREYRGYSVGLTWAEAVVDGDSERYRNAYHPRRQERPATATPDLGDRYAAPADLDPEMEFRRKRLEEEERLALNRLGC